MNIHHVHRVWTSLVPVSPRVVPVGSQFPVVLSLLTPSGRVPSPGTGLPGWVSVRPSRSVHRHGSGRSDVSDSILGRVELPEQSPR